MTRNCLDPGNQGQEPTLSVIIPIFNGERDLPELLPCLTAQTYPAERIEYVLVDNGSSDQTIGVLEAAVASLCAIRASALSLQERAIQSSYAARNLGIRAASADLLVFTDVDCRPQPEWLEQIILPFQNPAVGLVAGEVAALVGTSVLEQYAQRHGVLSQRHTLNHPYQPYGQTANLAVRRSVFEQVGLFRPYLSTGGDADLCWRSQSCGWQLQFAEQAMVRHRHRATWSGLWHQWWRYGQSNRYLHDLYGIDLMRELSAPDYLHRLSRWLLKEVPAAVKTVVTHSDNLSLIWDTPIDLFCRAARSQGQTQAHLPDQARIIEWLSSDSSLKIHKR